MQMLPWLRWLSLLAMGSSSSVAAAYTEGSQEVPTSRFLRRGLQDQAPTAACPEEYSLYHCTDPSRVFDIPCDATTCLFNLTSLNSSSPPGFCTNIAVINAEAQVPDVIKPCLLWERLFGPDVSALAPAPSACKSQCFRKTRKTHTWIV